MANHSHSPHTHQKGSGSLAAVNGHPIHPMLVPIVIGMYVTAACADVTFAQTGDPFWARSVNWLLIGTMVSALIAALPGMVDLLSIDQISKLPIAWAHAGGNGLFLVLVGVNCAMRQPDPTKSGLAGLAVTFLGLAVLAVSGWLGGEMTYRHGIGVSPLIGVTVDPQQKIDGDPVPQRRDAQSE